MHPKQQIDKCGKAKLAKPDTKLIPADVSDMSVWLYLFAPGLHATSQGERIRSHGLSWTTR